MKCLAVILINLSGLSWNAKDKLYIDRATHVCKTDKRYKSDTPCLKEFIKITNSSYRAICGTKK